MGSLTTEASCPVRSSAAVTRTVTAALGRAAKITNIVVGVADPLKTVTERNGTGSCGSVSLVFG